jgi:hypothetical protein
MGIIKIYVKKVSFGDGGRTGRGQMVMLARKSVSSLLLETKTAVEYWQLSCCQYYLVGGHV